MILPIIKCDNVRGCDMDASFYYELTEEGILSSALRRHVSSCGFHHHPNDVEPKWRMISKEEYLVACILYE